METNPILCHSTRCNIDEIVHRGVVCCVQAKPSGMYDVVYSAGNIEQMFYPRSALKVFILRIIYTTSILN